MQTKLFLFFYWLVVNKLIKFINSVEYNYWSLDLKILHFQNTDYLQMSGRQFD